MKRQLRTTTALAAVLAAGVAPLTLTTPASAAAAKYADDFNGDGFRDYAVYWSGDSKGGGVEVTFGTANGPGTRTQLVDQASPGVPGADEADDWFGEVRTAADFDKDGYGDLAVAATGEDVDGREDQGAVTILWGGPNGLSKGTTVPNKAPRDSLNRMGSDLATGDFNGDGKTDLALVNDAKTYVYRGSINRSGVHGSVTTLDKTTSFYSTALIAGKVNGDGKTDLVVIGDVVTDSYIASDAWFVKGGTTLTSGKTLRLESLSGNGGSTDRGGDGVIADFDKDGYGDIAVGTSVYSKAKGRVSVWYGSSSGPSTSTRITQATSGVAGTPETYDEFGWSVSAGDANGDGYKDLAVGVIGEAINGKEYAGGVHVLYGRASGLSGTRSQWFARNSAGVPGALEEGEHFGYAVRLRDTNADGRADLYVRGSVNTLRLPGSPTGVTTTGAASAEEKLIEGTLQ
ncbi:FG-GAP and VCBS repeat-containing protein [Streptomyces phaeochromogenes]|uniref:FG-GAP and VCBS repeat-containing protein n=1 Tax=Streptomyces phaeochromogenes TaxID=1923 RepID=UPI0006E28DBC|nr:FG-GAP and VCBS repeat-containing protein [Streptomyces phaeochromogenes]